MAAIIDLLYRSYDLIYRSFFQPRYKICLGEKLLKRFFCLCFIMGRHMVGQLPGILGCHWMESRSNSSALKDPER